MGRIFILVVLLVTVPASVHASECARTITSGQAAIDVLHKYDPSEHDPATIECIANAIDMIDELKLRAAIPELIRYLSFRKPLTPAEEKGFFLHPPLEGDRYPALRALARIGKPARPALLRVIEDAQSSVLVRDNAAHAVILSFAISPELDAAKGVEFLKAAKAEARPPTTKRDEEAIRYAITTEACKRIEPRCIVAANAR